MPKVIEGNLVASGIRVGVVISRFNEFITSKLLGACVDTLCRHGAESEDIDVMWCPGAYEIPLVAKRAAQSGRYDVVICLGAVIRGATPHFDYVAGECAKGIGAVSLETGVPTIFGVVTTDTIEQAIERAGTKAGNKGADAAMTAIEMVNLLRTMPEPAHKSERVTAGR
ncbi:MAG TPA: 6,7-dimethyl-8-ribityllumazine synthase [Candidatus Obscuribacterales bacterium]